MIVSNELDYKNIIYRTSETEIIRAKQHLWVEDLQTLLEGKLSQNLNSKSPYQLEFKIERFNGSFTGNAEIVGQWRYIDRKGEIAADGDFYKQVPLANEAIRPWLMPWAKDLTRFIKSFHSKSIKQGSPLSHFPVAKLLGSDSQDMKSGPQQTRVNFIS
ncbi:putative lipoprotein [Vibrio astriarenae]|nr:putative lipoprotein [Vibrio sp. C7]